MKFAEVSNEYDSMYQDSNMNPNYGDYTCRAYYASPMPEQRMRDDFSDTMSEWGLEQPLPLKLNRIPMRRPYEPRGGQREAIPQAYPKPGQELPAGIYSSPMQKPMDPYIKKTSQSTNSSPERTNRFFKKANYFNSKSSSAGRHHPYNGRKNLMKADPAHAAAPHGQQKHNRQMRNHHHHQRHQPHYVQQLQRPIPRINNTCDFDFKYPSYRRGQYANSLANSSPQSAFSMDKHRKMAEYRRRETERHLMLQAQQYGYEQPKTESQDDVTVSPSPPPEEALRQQKYKTSFSTSRDRVEKSSADSTSAASEDTESARNSTSVGDKKEMKNEKSISRSNSNADDDENNNTKTKVEGLKGITVENCKGIDIIPENTGPEITPEQSEKAKLDVDGEWEIYELPSYFDVVREVMPRTLFTSQREFNRPGSKWYSYDCRARMYIRQQPSHHPIQPQHVAPPPHLTKEEFYEVIGE